MKNNDDMLTRQGTIYTLVDKDGYLIREDTNGERKRYALVGEGGGGGAELPENIVNTVNGQTGDVTLDIPELPESIVNSFNTLSGNIDYPKFEASENSAAFQLNFDGKTWFGKIKYLATPILRLIVTYSTVNSSNIQYMKDKYIILKTSDAFEGVTIYFNHTATYNYPEWITNAEFAMEPNKTYLTRKVR